MKTVLIAIWLFALLATSAFAEALKFKSEAECLAYAASLLGESGALLEQVAGEAAKDSANKHALPRLNALAEVLQTAGKLAPEERQAAIILSEGELHTAHGRKSGSFESCEFNYQEMSTHQFYDALITAVALPSLEGPSKDPAYLALTLKPETVKLLQKSIGLCYEVLELPTVDEG